MIVSPSLAGLPRQHGHPVGLGMTTRSRGKCAGNGPRPGLARAAPLLVSAAGSGRLASSFGDVGLELFELQLELPAAGGCARRSGRSGRAAAWQ